MNQKNQGVLILTLLLVAGLFSVAGAVVWLGVQRNPQLVPTVNPSPAQSPTVNSPAPATPSAATPRSLNEVELKSDRNVDYRQLRAYLQTKNWKAANRETYLRMLDAAGPLAQARGMTPQSEMNTLSCVDLRTIDQLWSAATDGQQGFTTQLNIFRAVGSNYRKMYSALGWQKLPPSNAWLFEWQYNAQSRRIEFVPGKEPNYTNPPPGHFPTIEIGYNLDVAFSGALKRCSF